jgi:hypothetical protein
VFRFWFRVAYLMVLASACGLAYINSSGFKNEYVVGQYEMEPIGEAGFRYAWVNEEITPGLECRRFDACSFIDIQRAASCTSEIEVVVSFLDATDTELFRETSKVGGAETVDLKNVEIGTNKAQRFEWFVIEDIYCRGEPASGSATL